MQTKYFTIAGGNKTALIWDCPVGDKHIHIRKILPTVEQIGFVTGETNSHLSMMGEELCINALLALAAHLETTEGTISTPTHQEIFFKNFEDKTQIAITLTHSRVENIILFDGIGFICTQENNLILSDSLTTYAQRYALPAFGILAYDTDTRIAPKIHVVNTGSTLDETACGSGSVAMHLITGHNHIIQPTGEIISVHREGDTFYIEATVSTLS